MDIEERKKRLDRWDERSYEATWRIHRQVEELKNSPLKDEEIGVLSSLAFHADLAGREEVARNLPRMLVYEGVRKLSFIQELANDLGVEVPSDDNDSGSAA